MAADTNTSDTRAIAYDQRLAKAVVAAIRGVPVSPNVLTALGMAVGIASGLLFSQGTRGAMVGGSLLFMVAVWMDHVDGEFARATGKTSKFGHYFDHVAAMTGLDLPTILVAIDGLELTEHVARLPGDRLRSYERP